MWEVSEAVAQGLFIWAGVGSGEQGSRLMVQRSGLSFQGLGSGTGFRALWARGSGFRVGGMGSVLMIRII